MNILLCIKIQKVVNCTVYNMCILFILDIKLYIIKKEYKYTLVYYACALFLHYYNII